LNGIDSTDKEKRNITIGKLQIHNTSLSEYIMEETTGMVQYYLRKNEVKQEDIIAIQRDGIIISHPLKFTSDKFALRSILSKLIITLDRKRYLSIDSNGKVEVKGVKDKPIDTSFYDMFRNLNYGDKKLLLIGLNSIRDTILNAKKASWFGIEKDLNVIIPILGIGEICVSKSSLMRIEPKEIDKEFLWNDYIWPFTQPLLLYCV
jgi:hypothetical protein